MNSWAPLLNPTPLVPEPLSPLMRKLRRITVSLAPALTLMPGVPATRTLAIWPPPPSIVIALVIVTAPNPPGSRASISPPAAVFEMAPAKVLHGAVRLHGLASSPTPDTHVRVAWACASVVMPRVKTERIRTLFIWGLLLNLLNGNLDLKTLVEHCAPSKPRFVFRVGAKYSLLFGGAVTWLTIRLRFRPGGQPEYRETLEDGTRDQVSFPRRARRLRRR